MEESRVAECGQLLRHRDSSCQSGNDGDTGSKNVTGWQSGIGVRLPTRVIYLPRARL